MSVTEAQIYAENHGQDSAPAVASPAAPAGAGRSSSAAVSVTVQTKGPAANKAAAAVPAAQAKTAARVKGASPAVAGVKPGIPHNLPHKEPFPPFNSNYFASHILWLAVCFGFFYFFMARVVLPRLGAVIGTRRDRIAADLDQAARMKTEADAAVEAYQKTLADARNRAKALARKAAEEAGLKAEAERKALETGLEEQLSRAEETIAACRDKALADLDKSAGALAAAIVHKISGRKAEKAAIAQAIAAVGSKGGAAL